MRRKTRPPKDDLPAPWEDRPVSLERWRRHREVMLRNQYAGRRPEEWWLYERQMQPPSHQDEAAALYAMGKLHRGELDEVMRGWRQAYEHALESGFSYNSGDGWLEGAAARRAHYRWAGIPRDLVRKWDAERRRRAKVIRRRVKTATA